MDLTQARPRTSNWRLLAKLLPALALVAFIVPSSAFGQATRTWVSGVGNDANPCSRTAPCQTFAGAMSKTASGGEINCLDPGGFGTLTITKSLTIKCQYTEGGVLAAGTNGIVINAAATDKVMLRGLDINGAGTGAQSAANGVKVLSARSVTIKDSEIYRFKAGVTVLPTSATTRVRLLNNDIHDNGVGVFSAPGNNVINVVVTTLRNNDIHDNVCGAATSSTGTNNASTPNASSDCGASAASPGFGRTAVIRADHNGFFDNGTGVFARGSLAVFEIAYNWIGGNSAFGIRRLDGAVVRTFSPATNVISDNAASDAPNDTDPLTRPTHR